MSALGQKRTFQLRSGMSALPPKADITQNAQISSSRAKAPASQSELWPLRAFLYRIWYAELPLPLFAAERLMYRPAACSILLPGTPMVTLMLRTGLHMGNVGLIGFATRV